MICFLRHGKTAGNLEGRYVGRTNEPLCPLGIQELQALRPPPADTVYVSPMLRCVQTAALLYPQLSPIPVQGFQEMDFGEFEYRNYDELNGDPRYQAWIDSGGALAFPGGESRAAFCARCLAAFEGLLPRLESQNAVLIVHGGTIMALLERYGYPKRGYFAYQAGNGRGFEGVWRNGRVEEIRGV